MTVAAIVCVVAATFAGACTVMNYIMSRLASQICKDMKELCEKAAKAAEKL